MGKVVILCNLYLEENVLMMQIVFKQELVITVLAVLVSGKEITFI
jgi:hypothetical protein